MRIFKALKMINYIHEWNVLLRTQLYNHISELNEIKQHVKEKGSIDIKRVNDISLKYKEISENSDIDILGYDIDIPGVYLSHKDIKEKT